MQTINPRANRNTFWAAVLTEALVRAGVRTACISPGSRSTPLALALASHPSLTAYSHIDERSGAFFALGYAKASGRPVVLLSTSGTAAANFYPAVIEAQRSAVPLIVLTADRPPELRDTGAAQTIDQLKLYGGAVKWFLETGTPELHPDSLRQLAVWAGRAVFEALAPPAGVVHLNLAFRKPLEPTLVQGDVPAELAEPAVWSRHGETAFAKGSPATGQPDPAAIARVAKQVRKSRRGLIVCGPLAPREGLRAANDTSAQLEAWQDAAAALARHTGYPLLAEPPSGLRCGPHDQSLLLAHSEPILRTEGFRRSLAPEVVLRFGGPPTGKQFEILLREHPDCLVVLVNPGGQWLEPTHHPTELICADETAFCLALQEALGPLLASRNADWSPRLLAAETAARKVLGEMLTDGTTFDSPKLTAPKNTVAAAQADQAGSTPTWNEPRVFHELAMLLPAGSLLFTASSMPVRDLDAFLPATAKPVTHLVSRGANGIDGTLSTAMGVAAAHQEGPAVLVTGDLAFLHDSNGLLAARRCGVALTVILLNNNGGGIFDMLPIAQYAPHFEAQFVTPHATDFAALCAAHGVYHVLPANWATFRKAVNESLTSQETRVIEVYTERRANLAFRRRLFATVAQHIDSTTPASEPT